MRIFVFVYCSFFNFLFAESLKIGSDIAKANLIQFPDQHGNLYTFPRDTKYLLFASDMEASKWIHPYLMELKQEGLEEKKIVFLADIHRMPRIISKFIALPKMREYPYRIHLIEDEKLGSQFPKEKGKITILILKEYQIQKIEQIGTREDLEKLIN